MAATQKSLCVLSIDARRGNERVRRERVWRAVSANLCLVMCVRNGGGVIGRKTLPQSYHNLTTILPRPYHNLSKSLPQSYCLRRNY
eukprot:3905410-Prymnesium_polylepis.1